jgi:hypothetical protein
MLFEKQFLKYKLIVLIPLMMMAHFSLAYKKEDYAQLKEKYKNYSGVVLSHNQLVKIEVDKKTGELDIYVTDEEEILYLKESSKFYTEQSVALSHFFEDLTEISAMVYTPDGKKLKVADDDYRIVDSAPSSWVFHDDNKEMIFDLPELGEGYRSFISYTKKIKKAEFFDVFHFVSGYPSEFSKLTISYPESMKMKFFERAMDKSIVEHKTPVEKKGMITKEWTLKDVKAYNTEEGSTNIKNHIPHIVAQIQAYQYNNETVKLISNVGELHDYFEEFLLAKGDESDRNEMNAVVEEITNGMDDPIKKLDTIFSWVQSNIKYIAFEDGINGYVPRTCSSVMKNRYGDCKDMGNLLVEMLTYAGVENAHVAWVGTRDIPYLMSEIPSPLTCNHVICVVEVPENLNIDQKYFYLDATSSEGTFLYPPKGIQEKELLVQRASGEYDLFAVPAVNAKNNYTKSTIKLEFTTKDSLYGEGIEVYGGYDRETKSHYLNNMDQEDKYDYVKELALGGENRFTLAEYEISNLQNKKKDLQIGYKFSVDNLSIKDGDDIIMNPTLFKPRITKYHEEDYKYTRLKERHRTVDYSYEISFPQGYRLKHLPSDVSYTHDQFEFSGTFKQSENSVYVNMKYSYHLLEIPVDLFNDWNEFSRKINSATIQNIILEKIPEVNE